ncbi:MAG: hypothetical protein JWN04_1925 [Myxococcaceae bacterium]|nr:hypothetical protein [Myxococcaceae bacterium]
MPFYGRETNSPPADRTPTVRRSMKPHIVALAPLVALLCCSTDPGVPKPAVDSSVVDARATSDAAQSITVATDAAAALDAEPLDGIFDQQADAASMADTPPADAATGNAAADAAPTGRTIDGATGSSGDGGASNDAAQQTARDAATLSDVNETCSTHADCKTGLACVAFPAGLLLYSSCAGLKPTCQAAFSCYEKPGCTTNTCFMDPGTPGCVCYLCPYDRNPGCQVDDAGCYICESPQ